MIGSDEGIQPDNLGGVMVEKFTAVIKHDAGWWIGWIEEIPGVNCQERTRDELVEALRATLREAIDLNREEAIRAAGTEYEEQSIAI